MKINVVKHLAELNNVSETEVKELMNKGNLHLNANLIKDMIDAKIEDDSSWEVIYLDKVESIVAEFEDKSKVNNFRMSIKLCYNGGSQKEFGYIISFVKDQVVANTSESRKHLGANYFLEFAQVKPLVIKVLEHFVENKQLIGMVEKPKEFIPVLKECKLLP